VPQVVLDSPGVLPIVGQLVSAGVAQHVAVAVSDWSLRAAIQGRHPETMLRFETPKKPNNHGLCDGVTVRKGDFGEVALDSDPFVEWEARRGS
jgi:hypothetical protein